MLTDAFLQTFDDTLYPSALTKRYELMECLGKGEQSETLLIKEKRSGKKYISKCYCEQMMELGMNEANILEGLSFPSIPRFVEAISSDSMLCIVREYVDGITLDTLRQDHALSENEVIALGASLCDTLTYLHDQVPPIIHRDLKPQNIVLREDGSVAVIDFGISRVYDGQSETDTVVVGTKHFAAPEQYGFSQTDCRSDLFSLGVVLNYMLTGSAKVDASSLPDAPLKKAILGCTEFSPRDRFSNAQEVKALLTGSRSAKKTNRKKRFIAVTIVCSLMLVIAATVLISIKSKDFSEPLIEKAALTSLGKSPGDVLSEEDFLAVETLWIVGEECYKDGTAFYEGMPKWYEDGEIHSRLMSLKDLKRFPNLTEIGIVGAHISNLDPLTDLQQLVKVDFSENYISDISPLAHVKKLYAAHLGNNPLLDASSLAEHPDIFCLDLNQCDEYEPSFLSAFPFFEELRIGNETDSYKYLDGKRIQDLDLNCSELDSLDFLDNVSELQILNISRTQVTSLKGIAKHKELTSLDISHTDIDDLSPLSELPMLETLTVSSDMRKYVDAINTEKFSVVFTQ